MVDNNKPVLVVLSGAGISAESGLKTFRDADGLWEGYNIEEVATFEGWKANPKLVLDFYNLRRNAAIKAQPNLAHQILSELEAFFEVKVITQNVDDLHERAGSKNILHLHGKLNESRSSVQPDLIYPIFGDELNLGDCCELGSQLRPNIVWFGEEVPAIPQAADLVTEADVFLIIGTSLQVYPAAGLVNYFPINKPLFIIDPKPMPYIRNNQLRHIQKTAIEGMKELKDLLILQHGN
jgi:NAD-dependent deacetylase